MTFTPEEREALRFTPVGTLPACAFCGEPDATDMYAEEDYPASPCCEDEDACHARVQA